MALDEQKLRKPFKKLRKLIKKFPENAAPEQVHDLRTNSRKIEAITQGLMLDQKNGAAKLLRQIKPVRQRAGIVRDMDVLTGFASTLQVDGEDECRVQLLEHLGAQRVRHAEKLSREIRADARPLRKKLSKFADRIVKLTHDDDSGNSATEAAAVTLRMSADLREPARLDAGNIHEYRKKVKQLRYILQLSTQKDGFVDALGDVKDAIGEWHDWLELGAIAEEALDHGANCKLVKEIRAQAQSTLEHALQVTADMRVKYGGLPPKKTGRSQRPAAPSRPVLVAASSLVA